MGAAGSGKKTLINAMFNYVFNIKRDDPFLQLIQNQSSDRIAVYDIHEEELNIPFSLTIIDTPSFFGCSSMDQEVAEMIHDLFQDRSEIISLDIIGIVAPNSLPCRIRDDIHHDIFNTVSNIFGDDATGYIKFLLKDEFNHWDNFKNFFHTLSDVISI